MKNHGGARRNAGRKKLNYDARIIIEMPIEVKEKVVQKCKNEHITIADYVRSLLMNDLKES